MIIKANRHANGSKLAAYLLDGGRHGERVEEPRLKDFAADNIRDAFRDVEILAGGTKAENPFLHVQVRLPDHDHISRAQWEQTGDRIQRRLGLDAQPRADVYHLDEKTGEFHLHLVFSLIDADTLTAKPLPFFKLRLKALARELEREFGITQVKNQREGPLKYGATRDEEQQAQRLGFDKEAIRNTIRYCWDLSDCGRSFENSLAATGLFLAQGDHCDYVVLDPKGGIHALGKRILDVTAKHVREKLADLDRNEVPTIHDTRDFLLGLPRDRLDKLTRELAAVQEQMKAEREYANRDPVREQIAWEDAIAKAAIEKEKIEQRFLAKEDREPGTLAGGKEAAQEREQPPTQNESLIRMYRGIGNNVKMAAARSGEPIFFSTDPLRAAAFGELHYVDITPDELVKFERPHSKRILEAEPIAVNDWRTADPDIIARLRPLEEENRRTNSAAAEREYANRDPIREQIVWEDAIAEAAIEKERKERQFVETPAKKREPAHTRFGDILLSRAAETAMRDPRQQHGEPLTSAAVFRDALEQHRLALACVTPDEATKSHRQGKFAKEIERHAPVYQAGEIVIVREPRNGESTATGRVHKLDQTKAEDYLQCLALDKSRLQGIEATKQTLDDRAQIRQRAVEAAELRKARGPQHGGLVAHQMWALRQIRDAEHQRRQEQEYRRREEDDKRKRDAGDQIDAERYRADPEYRRHVQQTQEWKSPEDKQRDRENAARALMEQQDRGR